MSETAVVGKVVTLPCGFVKPGKIVVTEAEIVPMTGFTRKSIAREDIRNNPAKVQDVLLLQCLRKLGSEPINNRTINKLLIGDRDFLMMEIRRVSMKDVVTAHTECKKCKSPIEVKFHLDEIVVKSLGEKDYEWLEEQRVFRIRSTDPVLEAVFRFPDGEDQAAIAPLIQKNPVEANYKLYSRCLVEWNGKQEKVTSAFFENFQVDVLDVLDKGFQMALPGPELKQDVSCPACTADIEMTFEGSDFLFPIPPKRGQKS